MLHDVQYFLSLFLISVSYCSVFLYCKLTTVHGPVLVVFSFFVEQSNDYQIRCRNQLSISQNVCDVPPLLSSENIC